MDRTVATQVVALIVVLAALVRWIPGDAPEEDPLGRGAPLAALQLDAYLRELGQDDDLAPRAFLRWSRRDEAQLYRRYWHRRLRDARSLYERWLEDPDLFVQFKGVPRNEQWLLMYDIYPVPMTGVPLEEGSTEDDPTEPGAEVIESRLMRAEDIQRELRKQARDATGEGGR